MDCKSIIRETCDYESGKYRYPWQNKGKSNHIEKHDVSGTLLAINERKKEDFYDRIKKYIG